MLFMLQWTLFMDHWTCKTPLLCCELISQITEHISCISEHVKTISMNFMHYWTYFKHQWTHFMHQWSWMSNNLGPHSVNPCSDYYNQRVGLFRRAPEYIFTLIFLLSIIPVQVTKYTFSHLLLWMEFFAMRTSTRNERLLGGYGNPLVVLLIFQDGCLLWQIDWNFAFWRKFPQCSENFSIRFWRQYVSLFALIAAIVSLLLISERKSSHCFIQSLYKLSFVLPIAKIHLC